MGLAMESKGDELGGLNAYYKAAQLNPNYGPVAANIGTMNFSRGQYDEALVWLRRAADLQPNVSRVQANVALQYYSLGFDRQAVAWLERAIALQPQSPFPNLIYANIDLLAGRVEAARERVHVILGALPDDRSALYNAGFIELVSGDWKEAARHFGRLVEETGTRGLPYSGLAFALQKLGQKERAATILAETLEGLLSDSGIDLPGSQGRYALAQAYALSGRKEEALGSLERALAGGYHDRTAVLDPLLAGIRNEPRFRSAVKTAEARLERMRDRVRKLGLEK